MSGCRHLLRRLLAVLATRIISDLSTPAVIDASLKAGVNDELCAVVNALDKLYMACMTGHVPVNRDKGLH